MFKWVKFHGRHLRQIQGNLAGRNFGTESRVNSRLITHVQNADTNLKSTTTNGFDFRRINSLM